jgi:transcriptional regulator, propionate catabolism operon regulatory protein
MQSDIAYGSSFSGAGSRPRIRVISYTGLTRLVQAVALEYAARADIEIFDVVLDNAVAMGRELERAGGADVIISAGANAAMLRSTLSLPVVTIKPTGFDYLLALLKARRHAERVGIVTFREPIPEIEQVKEMLRIEISQRTYTTIDDAADCFRALADAGFKVIVGSSLVVDLAERAGIKGILVYTPQSAKQAIEDAIEIARVQRLEAQRYEQLNGVLRHLHEAVLAVDTKERIIAINPLMERLIDKSADKMLGQRFQDVVTELNLSAVLEGRAQDTGEVVVINGQTFVANRIAIRERGNISGALLTLQDADAIQKADSNIRTQRRVRPLAARYRFQHILGNSAAFQRALRTAERYARTSSTILITGESGTGKEMFAQAIHNANQRRANPFIAINCAAFPESLLESELFGHEEGAFTGSRKGGKPGLFETAHTGTIFLDEIGDMPFSLQTRLLRVLQEKEVMRLGSVRPVPIDVRIIAATHRDLAELIEDGKFRSDLYYRLNILRLHLPPLRERPEDIPPLALQMLHASLRRLGSSLPADQVLAPLMPVLRSHSWFGNVRELENVTERMAVMLCECGAPSGIDYGAISGEFPELFRRPGTIGRDGSTDQPRETLDDAEIRDAISRAGGNRLAAARLLGVSRTTLWRRIRSMSDAVPGAEGVAAE